MIGALAIRAFLVLKTGSVLSARIEHAHTVAEGLDARGRLNVSGTEGSRGAFIIPTWAFHHLADQIDDWSWASGADAALSGVGLDLAGQTYLEVSIAFGLFAGQFGSIRAQMHNIGEFPQFADEWDLGIHYTAQQHVSNDQHTLARVADMAYKYYDAAKIRKKISQSLFVQHAHDMQASVDARLPVVRQHLENLSSANSTHMLARVTRKALAVAKLDIQLKKQDSVEMMMQAISANTDGPLQINVLDMDASNPWINFRFTHLSRMESLDAPSDGGGPFRASKKLEKWTARNRWTLHVGQGESGQRNEAEWLLWSQGGTKADQLSIDGGWNWLKWSGWCGPLGSFISQDLSTIIEVSHS